MKQCEKKNPEMFRKGLTFVELIVVIAIIGIMTAVTYVSLQGLKPAKEAEIGSRQIAALLRQTQNDAVAGKMMDNGGSNKTPCAFVMKLSDVAGGVQYEKAYRQDNTGGAANGCAISSDSAPYETGTIPRIAVGGNNEIRFFVPHGGINMTSSKILLTSTTDNTKQATICIGASGNIEEKMGNQACP